MSDFHRSLDRAREKTNPLASGIHCPSCGTWLDKPERACPFSPHPDDESEVPALVVDSEHSARVAEWLTGEACADDVDGWSGRMIRAAITRLLDWLGNRMDIELDRLTDLGGEDE